MIETNSKSTSRLLEEACCWCKGFLCSKTLLMFALLLLPAMIFAQSNKQLSEKEARNQAYMEAIYGNKPEAVKAKQVNDVKPIQAQQEVAVEVVEQDPYQNIVNKLNLKGDELNIISPDMTNEEIEAAIVAEIERMENLSSSNVAARATASDNCANADTLWCSEGISTGSTVGFGNDNAAATRCGGPVSTSGGVWYKVVGNGEPTQVALSNAFAGAFLQLYGGDCNTLACNTDSNIGQGTQNLAFNTVDGQEYWVLVTGQGSNEGAFDIEAFNPSCSGPIGDGLSSATAFVADCGNVYSGDTTGFGNTEAGRVDCNDNFSTGQVGVWYSLNVTANYPNGTGVVLDLCGSGFDTEVSVYSGPNRDCVDYNDDFFDQCGSGNRSYLEFDAQANTDYYIYIAGYSTGNQVGPYEMQVNCDGVAPPPPPSVPANDLCVDATDLDCGTTLVDQSTVLATGGSSSSCFGSIGDDVWYLVQGTGFGINLTVNATGDEELQVEVYPVVDANCNNFTLGSCAFGADGFSNPSVVNWVSDENMVYYVRVGSWISSSPDTTFDITLTCQDPPSPPDNDLCEDAETIACGDTVSGDTLLATSQGVPFCDSDAATNSPGVWYAFAGTGDVVDLDLEGVNYDAVISVYTGGCNGLTCEIGENGDFSDDSSVRFLSQAGTDYLIFVSGFEGAVGDFNLEISCQPDPCGIAIPIACGDALAGSNSGANGSTAGPNPDEDCGTSPGVKGNFYVFQGTDQFVNINTCDSNFDTKLNVYSGSCGNLTCVTGNDDSASDFCAVDVNQSNLDFFANAGETYYIWVSGFSDREGDYVIELTCQDAVENDLCSEAVAISCGDSITGTTELATRRDAPFEGCDDATAENGVWYSVVGQGGDLVASTCDAADFDTQIIIYTGTCDDLTCYAANDDGAACTDGSSEVQFFGESGVTYYIYVSGFGEQRGEYTLSLDCVCYTPDTSECVTLYDGYTTEYSSTTLTGELLGTDGEIVSYMWSTGETTQSITVNANAGTQNYSVTITDEFGCSSTQNFFVLSVDVDCDRGNSNKVEICHNGTTICVNENAVQAHLNHGDTLGACGTELCDELIPLCDVSPVSPADGEVDVPANVTIQWSTATGVVDGYLISIGTSSGSDDVVNNADVGNNLSYDANLGNLTTYYYTITPYNVNGSAVGCSEFSFTTVDDPSRNDVCSGAVNLTVNSVSDPCAVTYQEDNSDNSDSNSTFSCDTAGTNIDSFFTFTAPASGNLEVEITNGSQTGTTEMALFDSCDGNQITCASGFNQGFQNLTPGASYTLAIWYDDFNTEGTFTICINEFVPAQPPANDDCENAQALTVNANFDCGIVTSGTTDGATASPQPDNITGTPNNDVWFSFVATNESHKIDILNKVYVSGGTFSSTDMGMAVYDASGGCSALTLVDDSDPDTLFVNGLTIGSTYLVRVYGWSSTVYNIDFDICVGSTPPTITVDCATSGYNDVYCYDSNDYIEWTFVSSNGSPLTLEFISGILEESSFSGNTFDDLFVYDGANDSGTLLFDSNDGISGNNDLAGMSWTANSGSMFVRFDADGSVSCAEGDTCCAAGWEFNVTCNGARVANPELAWNMYPNPTKGQVSLDLTDFRNNDINVQVIDLRGNIVLTKNVKNLQDPQLQIELNNVPYGMYMVRVQSNDSVSTKRLIINN